MAIKKHASAHWQGGIKDGKGQISTESGVLDKQPYGFNTRFEDEKGTNPEELIGAAHAGCFSMALSKILGEAGIENPTIDTQAEVALEKQDAGFAITAVHLDTTIKAAGDENTIEECAQKAKEGCPVSKALNAHISLTVNIGV